MTAEDQIKAIYDEFIRLHPNCQEPFDPTMENAQRWQWQISQIQSRPPYDAVDFKIEHDWLKMAESRSFSTFQQLPNYMRERYMEIASRFPGVQFYACGSRVTGTYVESFSGNAIHALRKAMGKPAKRESDYDVCVDIGKWKPALTRTEIRKKLPPYADLLNYGVPDNEKIPIPMWNFDLLPKSEHAKVIDLYKRRQWGDLMAIHNRYQLSPHYYCCKDEPIRNWFGMAIETGLIKDEGETEKVDK